MRSTALKRPSFVWNAPALQRRQRASLRAAAGRSHPAKPNGFADAASKASSGHAATQAPQSSQRRGLNGESASTGASVTRIAKRCRGPNSGVRNSPFRPVSPSPAACAKIRYLTMTLGAGFPGATGTPTACFPPS